MKERERERVRGREGGEWQSVEATNLSVYQPTTIPSPCPYSDICAFPSTNNYYTRKPPLLTGHARWKGREGVGDMEVWAWQCSHSLSCLFGFPHLTVFPSVIMWQRHHRNCVRSGNEHSLWIMLYIQRGDAEASWNCYSWEEWLSSCLPSGTMNVLIFRPLKLNWRGWGKVKGT